MVHVDDVHATLQLVQVPRMQLLPRAASPAFARTVGARPLAASAVGARAVSASLAAPASAASAPTASRV